VRAGIISLMIPITVIISKPDWMGLCTDSKSLFQALLLVPREGHNAIFSARKRFAVLNKVLIGQENAASTAILDGNVPPAVASRPA
jgi:hypothetical protein